MKTELIRIGNSRGIRIPKPLIEECRLGDIVELRVENERLIIAPNKPPRQGWDKAFREARGPEPDELLLEGIVPNKFDSKEWQW